jgi:hypothetical protein
MGRFRLTDWTTDQRIPLWRRVALLAILCAELGLLIWVTRSFQATTEWPEWIGWVVVLLIGLCVEIWVRPALLGPRPETPTATEADSK